MAEIQILVAFISIRWYSYCEMTILVDLSKISRKVQVIAVSVFIIGLFVTHIWFLNRLSNDWWSMYDQTSSLRAEILKQSGIPADKRNSVNFDEILTLSPLAQAYYELQERSHRLSRTQELLGTAFIIWPLMAIFVGGWVGLRYWRGFGLDPTTLQVRRYRVRLIGTLTLGCVLTSIIIFWRFSAGRSSFDPIYGDYNGLRFQTQLILAGMVAALGAFLVGALWDLMSSSMSRHRARMISVPVIYRLSIQAMVVAAVAFVMASDASGNGERIISSSVRFALEALAWVATTIALGSIMLGYLRLPGQSNRDSGGNPHERDSSPEAPAKDINLVPVSFPSPTPPASLSKLSDQIDLLVSRLEMNNGKPGRSKGGHSQYKNRTEASDQVVRLRSDLIRQRLLNEVQSLTKRGNVNLMIGSVTTLIAAMILWMLVAQAPTGGLGTPALLGYYLPRLSVAVFVEIFSFFFLRLYKNGLSELMYYQNELTNVEFKMLALEIAALLPSDQSMQQILQDLSKTDRNFVLKSGESTVELEKIRVEQQNIRSSFDNLLAKIPEFKTDLKIGK